MRYLIIADIHGNLTALEAVLKDAARQGAVGEIWCLGDIVGYGPEPAECIALVKELDGVCVAGNHDRGAIGQIEMQNFNPFAAMALEWTMDKLSAADMLYLGKLPEEAQIGDFMLVHGSPASPLFEYIISTGNAERNFNFFDTKYCLVGHTHAPAVFRQEPEKISAPMIMANKGFLLSDEKTIINPGAVGQPRDGDPRASYVIYDTDDHFLRFYRVEYDVRSVQDKMAQAGLPLQLIMRLETGK
ncbi:MAG: metallophosphoesterase family protein [Dehalococcoidales bacterium]|nr:metallophosphoesterase family protein [Dehalococcoidales bacterium]